VNVLGFCHYIKPCEKGEAVFPNTYIEELNL